MTLEKKGLTLKLKLKNDKKEVKDKEVKEKEPVQGSDEVKKNTFVRPNLIEPKKTFIKPKAEKQMEKKKIEAEKPAAAPRDFSGGSFVPKIIEIKKAKPAFSRYPNKGPGNFRRTDKPGLEGRRPDFKPNNFNNNRFREGSTPQARKPYGAGGSYNNNNSNNNNSYGNKPPYGSRPPYGNSAFRPAGNPGFKKPYENSAFKPERNFRDGKDNRPFYNKNGPQTPGQAPFKKPFIGRPNVLQVENHKEDKRKKKIEKERPEIRGLKTNNKSSYGNFSSFVGRVDENNLEDSFSSFGGKKYKVRKNRVENLVKEVKVAGPMSLKEIANKMSMRSFEVERKASSIGLNLNLESLIDEDSLHVLIEECGHTVLRVDEAEKERFNIPKQEIIEADLKERPPIVTIVGHVDHGKTSLLDKIRKSNVVKGEAGGITQHIGAYQIETADGKITFIDTPGHEAFTSMRARGVNITDIAILVVAADDSVKDQTIEAIHHLKAANANMIVAITKCDLPQANPDKVMQDLLSHDIVVEKYGGTIQAIEVSSHKGMNIQELLKLILVNAEFLELKASSKVEARGVVLESKVHPQKGPLCNVIILEGVLKRGAQCISDIYSGKVKAITNDQGILIKEAGPSTPVEIMGLSGAPEAGSIFANISDDSRVKDILEHRKEKSEIEEKTERKAFDFSAMQGEEKKKLNFIIRADTQGSLEAIKGSLAKIGSQDAEIDILFTGVGAPKESDLDLAKISDAIIFAFNTQAPGSLKKQAEQKGVKLIQHTIIYHLCEEVEEMISGMAKLKEREVELGTAKIQQVFYFSKLGNIAGCIVTDGVVKNGAYARLVRDGKVIYSSKVCSLKSNKNDAKEIRSGIECGMRMENFNDYSVDDLIVCYDIEFVK